MKLTFTEFKGTAPKFDAEQLVDGYASESVNTRTGRMMIEPWRAPVALAGGDFGSTNVDSAFFYEHNIDPTKWFTWSDIRYAVKAPLVQDVYDHVVIASANGTPQITASDVHGIGAGTSGTPVSFDLGIPRPNVPIITAEETPNPSWAKPTPNPTEDEYDDTYVSYTCMLVDAWGRVGPMSAPSRSLLHREHAFDAVLQATVTITTPQPPISTGRVLPRIRIFRSNFSGGAIGDYQFLTEVDWASTVVFQDSVYSGDLLESPISEDWVGPPSTNTALYPNGPMSKVMAVSGEFMCGHNKRIVCFSEPDAPHAWPVEYYKLFQEDVVTISAAGSNVVVLTDGFPYVLSGVHPSNMSPTRLADRVPCVSSLGVAEINDSVYYVASNGLYAIEGYRLQNVLEGFFTEQEWVELGPSTIMLGTYNDRLFISSKTKGKVYVFSPFDVADAIRVADFDPKFFHQMSATNDLAYVPRGGTSLQVFDEHATDFLAVSWTSKYYVFNEPVGFACARVKSKSYPVMVTFHCDHADGIHSFTKEVQSHSWFWLDMPYRSLEWWVSVDSTAGVIRPEIFNIQMASSPEEIE